MPGSWRRISPAAISTCGKLCFIYIYIYIYIYKIRYKLAVCLGPVSNWPSCMRLRKCFTRLGLLACSQSSNLETQKTTFVGPSHQFEWRQELLVSEVSRDFPLLTSRNKEQIRTDCFLMRRIGNFLSFGAAQILLSKCLLNRLIFEPYERYGIHSDVSLMQNKLDYTHTHTPNPHPHTPTHTHTYTCTHIHIHTPK